MSTTWDTDCERFRERFRGGKCFPCRRRYLKCDVLGSLPCVQCTKSGREEECEYPLGRESLQHVVKKGKLYSLAQHQTNSSSFHELEFPSISPHQTPCGTPTGSGSSDSGSVNLEDMSSMPDPIQDPDFNQLFNEHTDSIQFLEDHNSILQNLLPVLRNIGFSQLNNERTDSIQVLRDINPTLANFILLPNPRTFDHQSQVVDAGPHGAYDTLLDGIDGVNWEASSNSSLAHTKVDLKLRVQFYNLIPAMPRIPTSVFTDASSIFNTMTLTGRYEKLFRLNDQIQVPMQRHHLPLIGNILSPLDQTLSFSEIEISAHEILTKFLFQSTDLVTPDSPGLAPSDSEASIKSVASNMGRLRNEETARGKLPGDDCLGTRMEINNQVLQYIDFALGCTLITHWAGSHMQSGSAKASQIMNLEFDNVHNQAFGQSLQRLGYMSGNPEVIKAPYTIFPRRLWDLKMNRVIPCYLLQLPWNLGKEVSPGKLPVEYVAISHSWVDSTEIEDVYTAVNQFAWPVPLPRGADLELIRNEVLGYFPSIRYCWLDVLCLRQNPKVSRVVSQDSPELLEWRKILELGQATTPDSIDQDEEFRIDIPTIGNIYRHAAGVLRYFNGLGRPFGATDWDNQHHWLNRAWTLQESISSVRTINGGLMDDCMNPLNTISMWRGTKKRLRDCLHDIQRTLQKINSTRSMMALAKEMSLRYATGEVDKIAGLSYLLHFEELPIYLPGEQAEEAWLRCLNSAQITILAELFFNCPYADLLGLFPTWEQLESSPTCSIQQELPGPLSIALTRKMSRICPNPITGELHVAESSASGKIRFNREFKFYGYHLQVRIIRADSGVDFRGIAQTRQDPRYPNMVMNLRFFLGYDVDLPLTNDADTLYDLFTHSLNPCSTWVVILEGQKVGVLCSDEVFGGLHRLQILQKGKMERDGDRLKFYPRK